MASSTKYKAVRGMSGSPPADSKLWRGIEDSIIDTLKSYSYEEIRLPILEHSEVFNRSIGESTDIVQKEMYTFLDRNQESITLRPEGTAGCVRSALENGLLASKMPRKLWYHGPMFRYERPQKGRQRQFHQIGLEIFGASGILAEIELALIFTRIWNNLGLEDIHLEINSLGSLEDRKRYRKSLRDFLSPHLDDLDDQNRQKLKFNPLRLLDSKDANIRQLINDAPSITDFISTDANLRFGNFKEILCSSGIDFMENNRLVRGLDYYSDIVFEWTTSSLGSQNAVCAGGRYDNLVEEMGGKPTPAVGCAVGLERIFELCKLNNSQLVDSAPKIYVLSTDQNFQNEILLKSEELRDHFPLFNFETDISGGSLKSKMKKADKSGAEAAIIIGSEEVRSKMLTVKALRHSMDQESCKVTDLGNLLSRMLK